MASQKRMILYRYQPINKLTLTNLSKQKNWVADPLTFNDPFELHLKEEIGSIRQNEIGISHVERYDNREKIRKYISDFGVVCYSNFYDKKLMWSHYVDCHKGMCLAFKIPKDNVEKGFIKVEYSKEIPDAYFNVDDADNWSKLIRIVRTKSIEWEYENEYRQVFLKKNVYENYPGKLVEVIFGSQATRSDIDLIVNILKSYNEEIVLSKMYLSVYSFQLGKMSMTLRKGEKYWIPDIWDGKRVK